MKKENKIIISVVMFITMMIMFSISVFAGDIETNDARIDFIIDSNSIANEDVILNSDVIAVNSDGYTFEKDYQFIDTLSCKQYEIKQNATSGATYEVCANWDTQQELSKIVLAKLEFKTCNEGGFYRIYKTNDFTSNKNYIINNGEPFVDVQCIGGKVSFEIDSFSSYTIDEINGLKANNVLYYTNEPSDLSGSNPQDVTGNGNHGTNTGVVTGTSMIVGDGLTFADATDEINAGDTLDLGLSDLSIIVNFNTSNSGSSQYIVSKSVGSGTTDGYVIYILSTGAIRCIVGRGTSQYLATSSGTFNDGVEHQAVCSIDRSGNMNLYVDNVSVASVGISVMSSDNVNTTNDLIVGNSIDSDSIFVGNIDEVGIFYRALNSDNVSAHYDLFLQGESIYSYDTNVSNTAPSGQSISNPSNNEDYYNYFNTSLNVTWNTATDSEGDPIVYRLYEDGVDISGNTTNLYYNIDLTLKAFDNYTLIVEACDDENLCSNSTSVNYEYQEVNYTSALSVDFHEEDITISATNYNTIFNFKFNSSFNDETFFLTNRFENVKLSGVVDNDLYIEFLLDGVQLEESIVAHLTSIGDYKIGQTKPIIFNVDSGEHEIVVNARRTGNGDVNISQVDLNFFQTRSDDYISLFTNNESNTYTFNNQSYQDIATFETNVDITQNLHTFARLSITSTGATDVWCRLRDNLNGLYSNEVGRYIKSSSDTGIATFSATSLSRGTFFNNTAQCYNSNNEDVSVQVDYINLGLVDNSSSVIPFSFGFNPSSNSTIPRNLTAGYYELASFNHTIKDGDYVFISGIASLGSNTGEQTPKLILDSNSTSCDDTSQRYIQDNSDIASIFIYHNCDGLTIGNTYSFTLNLEVETGEEVVVYDEFFSGFETNVLNVSSQNIAPFPVTITSPANTTSYNNQSTSFNLVWTNTTDINGDDFDFNIYLDGNLNQSNLNTLSTTINLSDLTFNNYTLIVEVCDNLSLCSNSSTLHFEYTEFIPTTTIDGFNYGECPIESTALSLMFFSICVVLTLFAFMGFMFKSPFILFACGLGLIICSWFIVGCVGILGYIFVMLGVVMLLSGATIPY